MPLASLRFAWFLVLCSMLGTTVLVPSAAAFPGDLAASFGVDGVVSDPTLPPGRAVALQSDGKIVVVHDGGRLSRFAPNGSLDQTFGTGGVVTLPFRALAVVVQSDGSILVAGGDFGDFSLARYDGNGTLDPSFGSGGVAVSSVGPSGYATGMVVQSSGAIVLAGTAVEPGHARKFVLVRFTSTGALDPTFGTAGQVTAPLEATWDIVRLRLAVNDGLIVIGSSGGATVIRYDSEGDLDATFGTGGFFWRGDFDATDGALQADGAIVITGFVDPPFTIGTSRITAAGALDPTFGAGGTVAYGAGFGASVAFEPSGDVVVAGQTLYEANPGIRSRLAVLRYTVAGAPDADFGTAGIAETTIDASAAIVASVRDGDTLVAVGVRLASAASTDESFVLARYQLGPLCRVRSTCKSPAPGRSTFELRDDLDDERDRFVWRYRKGEATALTELGDPRTSDRYALCIFDESGAEPVATAGIPLPPGPSCGTSPCWHAVSRKGFKYGGPPTAAEGVSMVTLVSGDDGKSSISIAGRGPALPPADLPRSLPVRLQLQASNGSCWQSVFSSAGVRRNDGARFKAKSD